VQIQDKILLIVLYTVRFDAYIFWCIFWILCALWFFECFYRA